MLYVRKKKERSHDTLPIKKDFSRINIFVDDHIFQGETITWCYKQMRGECGSFQFDYLLVGWIRPIVLNDIGYMSKNLVYCNNL